MTALQLGHIFVSTPLGGSLPQVGHILMPRGTTEPHHIQYRRGGGKGFKILRIKTPIAEPRITNGTLIRTWKEDARNANIIKGMPPSDGINGEK